jgi:hypothetical protein
VDCAIIHLWRLGTGPLANAEGSSSRAGKKSGSGFSSKSDSSQGGTTEQMKAAGRKGGKACRPPVACLTRDG